MTKNLETQSEYPLLALTMGDPNGIGAEVLLKALEGLRPFHNWQPLVFGDMEVLENLRERLQLEWVFQAVTDVLPPASFQAGTAQIPVISLGSETEQHWQPGI